MRESLYRYGSDELSLRVFNEEDLYLKRHSKGFIRYLHSIYQCTNAQVAELKTDLLADKAEMSQYEKAN